MLHHSLLSLYVFTVFVLQCNDRVAPVPTQHTVMKHGGGGIAPYRLHENSVSLN
jgi:hypothetical protein